MIQFSCPNCRRTLKAPPDLAGKRSKCKGCNAGLVIPVGPRSVIPPPPILPAPTSPGNALDFTAASVPRPVSNPIVGVDEGQSESNDPASSRMKRRRQYSGQQVLYISLAGIVVILISVVVTMVDPIV